MVVMALRLILREKDSFPFREYRDAFDLSDALFLVEYRRGIGEVHRICKRLGSVFKSKEKQLTPMCLQGKVESTRKFLALTPL